MNNFGSAVAEKTGMDKADAENLLRKYRIELSAATPAPKHLVFRHLSFTGTKTLTGQHADGTEAELGAVEDVPFEFDWEFDTGLHGIGSDQNLRGKSSILHLLMWVLRGRNGLRSTIVEWIDRVDCDFDVDGTRFHVGFNIVDKSPVGELTRTSPTGSVSTVGRFADDEAFETLMDRTMLDTLGLPVIPGAVEGRRVEHTWQAYAAALLINGDTLKYLVGEHGFSLPGRLLSSFVGSDWSAVRAQVTTALNVTKQELDGLRKSEESAASAAADSHRHAQAIVDVVRARLDALSAETVTASQVGAALARLAALDEAAPALQQRMLVARSAHHHAVEALRVAEAEEHAEMETELASRFFHSMQPSACPRCSAPVTREQRKAEAEGTSCSVCTHDLDQGAADMADDGDRTVAPDDDDDDDDEVVDTTDALRGVVEGTAATLAAAEAEQAEALAQRQSDSAVVTASRASQAAAEERRQIELDLARAEGAASAYEPAALDGGNPAAIALLDADVKALGAAKKIADAWVTEQQEEPLAELGRDIIGLARSFGMVGLSDVKLGGNATLKVWAGGEPENYSDCERGEQLRLKLAAMIALIRLSRASGVGRHPGFLMVDSLAAEEIPDTDFEAMLGALHQVAQDLDIQLFIATRHTDTLEDLLGAGRCRLGRGTNFVW